MIGHFSARAFSLLVSLFFAQEALAYSPPPSFIVGRAIKERKGLRSIEWIARITEVRSQISFKEHLRIEFPSGRMVANYSGPSDESWGSHESDSSALSRLGRFWISVGLDPNGARVKAALSELGVLPEETAESKLLREGKSVTWTWGDGAKILFGKDTFLPVGYSGRSEQGAEGLRFESFMLAGNHLQIPKAGAVTAGAANYRFEIRSVKVDAPSKGFTAAPVRVEAPPAKGWVSLVR